MKKTLSLRQKRSLAGILFISPWLIGLVLLFVYPLVLSIQFSLSKLSVDASGYSLSYVGFDNYHEMFFVDARYVRELVNVTLKMALDVPLILFFSLFTATLLTQKFRGRAIARAIIFLPVVLASGVISQLDSSNLLADMIGAAAASNESNFAGFEGIELAPLLLETGISNNIVSYLTTAVERIYQVVSASGVQILIFLAGLQSISSSLYEAAKMEGATGYESFWKITFPIISPLILTAVVYTIVDSFYVSTVTNYIYNKAFVSFNFGLSAAMAIVYCLMTTLILAITAFLVSRKVFYQD